MDIFFLWDKSKRLSDNKTTSQVHNCWRLRLLNLQNWTALLRVKFRLNYLTGPPNFTVRILASPRFVLHWTGPIWLSCPGWKSWYPVTYACSQKTLKSDLDQSPLLANAIILHSLKSPQELLGICQIIWTSLQVISKNFKSWKFLSTQGYFIEQPDVDLHVRYLWWHWCLIINLPWNMARWILWSRSQTWKSKARGTLVVVE